MASDGSISGKEIFLDDAIERIKLVLDLFDDLILKFDAVEKKAKSANNSISFAEAEKENAEAIKKSKTALSEYEKTQKRLEQQEEKRAVAQTRLARRLAEQRTETQRINRETRRNTIIANENERAYKRLSAELARQTDELKDLVIQYGAASKEVRDFAREVEKTRSKIKAADDVAKDYRRNVGNYPSAFKGAIGVTKQLIGAFGVVEGIRLGFNIIKDLSAMAREAKGVEFAFKRLGAEGEDAFQRIRTQTRGLFSDLEIKQAIVEFDNFRLSAQQLDTIFEFIAVRAAQTGQSFEYLKNSAVEAITKESVLRADNLGISQKALNEELSRGVDFLTAFGNVARREINRAGDILDEAADGSQQFSTNLENIKLQLGQIINQVQGFGVINSFFSGLSDSVKLTNFYFQDQVSYMDQLRSAYRVFYPAGRAENERLVIEIENRLKLEEQIRKQIEAERELYEQREDFVGPRSENNQQDEEQFDFLRGPGSTIKIRIEELNTQIEEYVKKLEKTNVADQTAINFIRQKLKALREERDALTELFETQDKATKSNEKFIATFDLLSEDTLTTTINFLRGMQKEVAIGSSEWFKLDQQIKQVEKTLKDLLNNANLDLSQIEFIDPEDAQIAIDADEFLNTEGILLASKLLASALKTDQEELLAEFDALYERDYTNFLKWAKAKTEAEIAENNRREQVLSDIINVGQDFAQAFYEIQANRIDDEIEKQNEAFDNIVNSKEASEETIAIAEKKRTENEKRLRKEREKAERRAFLIQQAMEVARVILADATARANATATSFLLPPGAAQGYLALAQAQITTNTAIALAAILAQSIPAFFKGKNALDSYEGPATWGEKRKEVRVTEDGKVEISPNKTTPLWVNRNDIITPSVPEFERQMKNPESEIFRRVVGNKYRADTQSRMQVVYIKSENDKGMSSKLDQTNRLLRKIERKETRFDPKIVLEPPTKYFSA